MASFSFSHLEKSCLLIKIIIWGQQLQIYMSTVSSLVVATFYYIYTCKNHNMRVVSLEINILWKVADILTNWNKTASFLFFYLWKL